jgi:hypothetical protein
VPKVEEMPKMPKVPKMPKMLTVPNDLNGPNGFNDLNDPNDPNELNDGENAGRSCESIIRETLFNHKQQRSRFEGIQRGSVAVAQICATGRKNL